MDGGGEGLRDGGDEPVLSLPVQHLLVLQHPIQLLFYLEHTTVKDNMKHSTTLEKLLLRSADSSHIFLSVLHTCTSQTTSSRVWWDTLLSGMFTESSALFLHRAPLHSLQLPLQSRKPLLLLGTQSGYLLLLSGHQLVELRQVGVVDHAHLPHPLVSEWWSEYGMKLVFSQRYRPSSARLTVTMREEENSQAGSCTLLDPVTCTSLLVFL